MSVTLTFEQIATVSAGLATLVLLVWRARPYVQGEVQLAVDPIRLELHAWREESVRRHDETQTTMQQILDTMRPLQSRVDSLETGNAAGKAGIVRLSADAAEREKRVHNLEVNAKFVDLNGAAQKAAGVA